MEVYEDGQDDDENAPLPKLSRMDEGDVFAEQAGIQDEEEEAIANCNLQSIHEEDIMNANETEEEVIEYVEEFSYGQVVHGEDNQYYVVMEKDTPNFDFEKLNNVRVVLNEDGTKTLLMENTTQKENLLSDPIISTNFNDPYTSVAPPRPKRDKMDEGLVELDGEHDTFGDDMMDGRPFNTNGKRHARVYGDFKCPECDQAFVNTARLERHLAVHQVYGSFLCPLCGKTYKYEYNLFYHWRRTCRDMNDLLSYNERKNMEVTNLRQLVEEIAQKKANIGPLELGISGSHLYRNSGGNPPIEMHATIFGRRSGICKECGITTLEAHLPRHYGVHRGDAPVGERSVGGGFFCDLCGLMFRQQFNLIKHWRSDCTELCNNLPPNFDVEMDDSSLKRMVNDLVRKAGVNNGYKQYERGVDLATLSEAADAIEPGSLLKPGVYNEEDETLHGVRANLDDDADQRATTSTDIDRHHPTTSNSSGRINRPLLNRNQSMDLMAPTTSADVDEYNDSRHLSQMEREEMDEKWMNDQGIIFADDLMANDNMLMINEDGQLCSMQDTQNGVVTSGAIGPTVDQMSAPLGGGNIAPGMNVYTAIHPMEADRFISRGSSQAVQCSECFRSFANVARLERHLAGAHSSYGTHHCQLCGNRFKYEYNLLYHIRRACPYSKAMIEDDVREQLPAINLKKLVRTLASQDFVRLPAEQSIMNAMNFNHKPDLGDAMIRQQMMRSVMPNYRNNTSSAGGVEQPTVLAPPPSQQSLLPRPGFPEGKKCPVCSIIFYGANILARHLKVAHPADFEIWEAELDEENVDLYPVQNHQRHDSISNVESHYQMDLQPHYRRTGQFNERRKQHRFMEGEDEEENLREDEQLLSSTTHPRQHLPLRRSARVQEGNQLRRHDSESAEDAEVGYGGESVQGNELVEIEPPPTLQPEPEVDDPQDEGDEEERHYVNNYSRMRGVDEYGNVVTMADYRRQIRQHVGQDLGHHRQQHYDQLGDHSHQYAPPQQQHHQIPTTSRHADEMIFDEDFQEQLEGGNEVKDKIANF